MSLLAFLYFLNLGLFQGNLLHLFGRSLGQHPCSFVNHFLGYLLVANNQLSLILFLSL